MKIEENVPLTSLTTFRTGGPARFLLTVEQKNEIQDAVAFAETQNLPIVPLGSGSNMLPPDSGLDAVLVKYAPDAISASEEGDSVVVSAEGGALWDALVAHAVAHGWWGIENLSAIPGTVGAAVVQNIGAYGAVIGDTLHSVRAYDIYEKQFITLTKEMCALGYRTSIFKKHPDRYVVVEVMLVLSKRGAANLTYRDLSVYFKEHDVPADLLHVREAVVAIRAGKFPELSEYGTAGSFFLNPIFTERDVEAIRKKYPDMPVYPLPEGGVKVPLAWIFDQILKAKGRRVGGAFIWDKQPLVIASDLHATTHDVVLLAESIVKDFFAETGITITPEVRLFGEEKKKFE